MQESALNENGQGGRATHTGDIRSTADILDKNAAIDEFSLRDSLRQLRTLIPDSPWLNPITVIAFELSRKLERGEISLEELKALYKRLLDRACVQRSRRLAERAGFEGADATAEDFSEFVRSTGYKPDGTTRTLEEFAQRWQRARAGVVLTAHPTFGCSRELYRRMTQIAADPSLGEELIADLPHRPDPEITLNSEHAFTQETLNTLRDAHQDLLEIFFATASERFGEAALKIKPQLMTLASWVGYDLDGRTDITWIQTFCLRLEEKQAGLNDVRSRFLALRANLGNESDVERLSRQLIGKLDLAIAAVENQAKAMREARADQSKLAAAANLITSADGYNITSTETITSILDALVDALGETQRDQKIKIAALRSLIMATGLGTANIHVRINAAQLSNALRAFVHEPWTHDLTERQTLARLAEMIEAVEPESVNFETLDLETATAIRQMAMIAQIKKHIDGDTPIRFLIAECESPASILVAVLFAKMFGISDIVDISPLFETPDGLERGPRLLERLLEEKSYRDYVRGRGRLSIQTGFSDAGRFIGQIPATLSIERLHFALADLMAKAGLQEVETLIFSTHGESMGRGAHPGTLRERLQYLYSPEARLRFQKAGLPFKHETSFQGGDGFLFFGSRDLTACALSHIVQDAAAVPETHDPFYDDENLSLDFFLRLRNYQQELFANPGYRALLGAYGSNMLFKTGSRAVKRQSDSATVADRGDPSRMRAIPNNAILQQFGYVANVVAGLGDAAGYDRDKIVRLARNSPRLRSLLGMVARGKQLSSINAIGANAYAFDAGFWASRASWGREEHIEAACRTLSTTLLGDTRANDIHVLMHHLRLDAIDLHAILEEFGLEGGKVPDDSRLELDLLQAIRSAFVMRIFILCAQMPRFAPRNGQSPEGVLAQGLSLNIPEVLQFMRQAFPSTIAREDEGKAGERFNESASYRPHGIDDYARLETEILTPIEEAYEAAREISTGICHHFGAFG